MGLRRAYPEPGVSICVAWGDEVLCGSGEYSPVLPDLLGAALPEGSGPGGAADGDHHRPAVGGGEELICTGVALAGLSGSVWAVLYLGGVDGVGVSVGAFTVGVGPLLGGLR